jgi:hypothetical protein
MWSYDRYGNRLSQSGLGGTLSIYQPQLSVDAYTNRITSGGYGYDYAGNLTSDGVHSYAYDAENRMKTVDSTAATYTYSGNGLRVKKQAGGITTVYVFSGTQVIAEYSGGALSQEYIYAGSARLATVAGGTVTYYHPDHLSNRLETATPSMRPA